MIVLPNDQLLVSVVGRGWGDQVVQLAKQAGARGSTVLIGRGTARNKFLQWLGLADTEKELIFTLASRQEMQAIITKLQSDPNLAKKTFGVGILMHVLSFLRSGIANPSNPSPQITEGSLMNTNCETKHQLICVIVNTGYADDIMLTARKAGAKGGTILKARGTGTEQDSGFFGITIVPEKEMVLILVKSEISRTILSAIDNCKELSEPGVGILFIMPVEDFFPLGVKTTISH